MSRTIVGILNEHGHGGECLKDIPLVEYIRLLGLYESNNDFDNLLNEINAYNTAQRAELGVTQQTQQQTSAGQPNNQQSGVIDLTNVPAGTQIKTPRGMITPKTLASNGPIRKKMPCNDSDKDGVVIKTTDKNQTINIGPSEEPKDLGMDDAEKEIRDMMSKFGITSINSDPKSKPIVGAVSEDEIHEDGAPKISFPHSYAAMGRDGTKTAKQVQSELKKPEKPGPKKGATYRKRKF